MRRPAETTTGGSTHALIISPSETSLQPEMTVNLPAILADAGEDAVTRFVEYFTAHIRNPHTRRAYFRNAISFLRWCEDRGIHQPQGHQAHHCRRLHRATPARPTPSRRSSSTSPPSACSSTGWSPARSSPSNPAHAVRGPKHVVTKGKTPVLTAEETRALLDSIPTTSIGRAGTWGGTRSASPIWSACATGRSSPRWSTPSPASAPWSP